ncbi:MAG: LicD family protein [Lachnospiraceae bacterium]|nr:LicD family protein [Lachnospiraceae bacterium]
MMENMDLIQKRLWDTEQEILDVIHKVCEEHNLRYSLAWGTLIGAIRHQGFIPWDDDVDIMMPREDYDKLMELWPTLGLSDYILEDYHTDNGYVNNFAKVRKNHTTFLQYEVERERGHHKGVFVDIFPGDRRAPGKISGIIQYIAGAVNLLYSRGYTSGSKGYIGIVEKILLKTDRKNYFKRKLKAEKWVTRWNGCDTEYMFPCTIQCCRQYYPSDLFEDFINVPFNGKQYKSIQKYDEYLRISYGNYMEFPPMEERVWKHHPIIVDFEHNYEELLEK